MSIYRHCVQTCRRLAFVWFIFEIHFNVAMIELFSIP